MKGIFYKENSEYKEKLDPVKGYLEQITHLIKVKKGFTQERSREIATEILKSKFKDKHVKYFEREENGDRVVKDGTLLGYIKQNIEDENILVPTFTSYCNSKHKKSILSEFIGVNVKIRSIAKKESMQAFAEGDLELAESKNNEQSGKKIYNNALSGLFGLKTCILHNPTAHSALTSITRTITSLTNACNERLVAGNRYLPRQSDVMRSVVYESTYTEEDKIKKAVEQYNMYLPTVSDTVDVLKRSSDLYFVDEPYYEKYIIPFLNNLNPYQLANICYNGDMYHQRVYNPEVLREIFIDLTAIVEPDGTNLDDVSVIHQLDESIVLYVHTLMNKYIMGMGKDYDKMNVDGRAKAIYLTCLKIMETLNKHKAYFNAFFMTPIVPINSHRLRNMRRRVVVLSDTDSSAFTMDEWVKWWSGQFLVSPETIGLAGAITFIVSGNIVNQLAILSRSMNISDELLNTLAMKNEYLWSLHVPAEVSKHYFANTIFREGNVFDKPLLEVKGVHLKNSAVPVSVVERGDKLMTHILATIHNNKKLKLRDVLSEVIAIENMIIDSINKGEAVYLKRASIKDASAYSQGPDRSPYHRHVLWKDVFEPTYGQIEEPPYSVVKLPTIVTNKTGLKEWLDSMTNLDLRARLEKWLLDHNKNNLPTLYLNQSYADGSGIPPEMASIIDVRRIVFDTTLQLRVILESLGVHLNEDKLVKEQFDITETTITDRKCFSWVRKGNGYEVSSKGDKRFSAFFAKLPDGRSIEQIYQGVIKGYGNNWKEGKGKPPLNSNVDLWKGYLALWKLWAKHNPKLIEELRVKAAEKDGVLTDMFATTDVNQANALSVILNETIGK